VQEEVEPEEEEAPANPFAAFFGGSSKKVRTSHSPHLSSTCSDPRTPSRAHT
jgi:hypothetical protein